MKTEPQVKAAEPQVQPGEHDSNELRELTLEEMAEVGGGIIKHAPVADSNRGRF